MPGIPPYYDWIAHHAHRRPGHLAIDDLQTARKFTYAELDRRSDALGAGLKKALYNYMHGLGLDDDVRGWFDF